MVIFDAQVTAPRDNYLVNDLTVANVSIFVVLRFEWGLEETLMLAKADLHIAGGAQ